MRKIKKDERWFVSVPAEKFADAPLRGEWDILDDSEWRLFSTNVPEYFAMHGLSEKILAKWRHDRRMVTETMQKKVIWRLRKFGWLALNRNWVPPAP